MYDLRQMFHDSGIVKFLQTFFKDKCERRRRKRRNSIIEKLCKTKYGKCDWHRLSIDKQI